MYILTQRDIICHRKVCIFPILLTFCSEYVNIISNNYILRWTI
nr:MAG TPA: hypothetical protein [Caudoviricetes sp.]